MHQNPSDQSGYREIREFLKEEWPQRLLEIPQPPKKLFIRGSFPSNQNEDGNKSLASKNPSQDLKFLCVVGSRKFTSYGKEACEHLIKNLRGWPIVIVSGLAFGIDSIAHEAALEVGLQTIAIPGSGLSDKVLYPRNHFHLAQNILKNGGALISEYEDDFRATPWSFPQRNRIMVGISHAILIIEASSKSGTMITARMAADYNRDVLALPSSIFNQTSEGTHYLLKNGATPVRTAEDILEILGFETSSDPITLDIFKYISALPPDEQTLIILLQREPATFSQLIENTTFSQALLNELLSSLEVKGLILRENIKFRLV